MPWSGRFGGLSYFTTCKGYHCIAVLCGICQFNVTPVKCGENKLFTPKSRVFSCGGNLWGVMVSHPLIVPRMDPTQCYIMGLKASRVSSCPATTVFACFYC